MNNQVNGAGWQTYQDPRFGFQASFPPGWSIHADEQAIQMWSGDGASFALVVPFRSQPPIQSPLGFPVGMAGGNDNGLAEQIGRLPMLFPRLFPQLRIQRILPPAGPGGDAAGEFVYPFANGAGQARALCSRAPDGSSGMLYVIAAPMMRFPTDMPVLLDIMRSLVFPGAPAQTAAPPGVPPPVSDPQTTERAIRNAAKSLQWVSWSDPRENAFHIEAPQGWAVEGGAFRHGLTDTRMSVQIRSPDSKVVVQSGDPNLPVLQEPSFIDLQMGMREGQLVSPNGNFQSLLLRPMPAPLFARWYCQNFLGNEVEGLTPLGERAQPEASQQQTLTFQQRGMPGHVEVALADFKGRSRRTGLSVNGVLMVTVTYFQPIVTGPVGSMTWHAQPIWSLSTEESDPQATEALSATAGAVVLHLMQTWRDDEVWTARNNQIMNAQTQAQFETNRQISRMQHESAMDNIRQAGERSRQMARDADDRRQVMMDSFHQRMHASDENQRHFVNYIGDRTDVRDPNTGQAWKVSSGSTHYYHNSQSNTILGTDSAYSPGTNWTLLNEF